MILTAKQEEGLKIAVARYKAHEAYTCISGYAGTGKSTLIKFIIAAMGLAPEIIDSAVRISFSRYNTTQETDMLIEAVKEAAQKYGRKGTL